MFPPRILAYLQETQPKLRGSMSAQHGAELDALILKILVKELETKSALHDLRHGFKFYGQTFRIATFKPAQSLNYEILKLYGKNELTVTRQVACHPNGGQTMDMVLLPVATVELKNPLTNQTWRDAVNQYKAERDPRVRATQTTVPGA